MTILHGSTLFTTQQHIAKDFVKKDSIKTKSFSSPHIYALKTLHLSIHTKRHIKTFVTIFYRSHTHTHTHTYYTYIEKTVTSSYPTQGHLKHTPSVQVIIATCARAKCLFRSFPLPLPTRHTSATVRNRGKTSTRTHTCAQPRECVARYRTSEGEVV